MMEKKGTLFLLPLRKGTRAQKRNSRLLSEAGRQWRSRHRGNMLAAWYRGRVA